MCHLLGLLDCAVMVEVWGVHVWPGELVVKERKHACVSREGWNTYMSMCTPHHACQLHIQCKCKQGNTYK